MPVLKQKPVLDPKPPCGGCDFCGDCREDGLYLLGYKGKYYCHVCFFKVVVNWPKRSKARIERVPESIKERSWRLAVIRHADNKKKGFVDYNVSADKRAPADQEDAFGLMAELLFADFIEIELSDEQLITYRGPSNPDHCPGVEVRGRSFMSKWPSKDIPVWDKDAQKGLHTLIAYVFDRDTLNYEMRWLPFDVAWAKRRKIKMGTTGRDMPGISFSEMDDDLESLKRRLDERRVGARETGHTRDVSHDVGDGDGGREQEEAVR